MFTCADVRNLIETGLPEAQADVRTFAGGPDHFEAVVIAPQFDGLSMVKQHQLVYGAVQPHLSNGTIHALGLKTYTPAQWAEQQGGAP